MKLFFLLTRWAAVFVISFACSYQLVRFTRHTAWFKERAYHKLVAGDENQRLHAASVLAEVGAEEQLLRALKEPEPGVHEMARRGVEHLWFYSAGEEAYRLMDSAYRAAEEKRELEAIHALDTIITRFPRYAEAFNRRAAIHWQAGHHAQSRRDCEMALKLNPNNYAAWQGLGVCQLQDGEIADACRSLRSSLRIAPHDESARRSLHECEQLLQRARPDPRRGRPTDIL